MERSRHHNHLRNRIREGAFVVSIETVTPEASEEFEAAIGPIIELASLIKSDSRIHAIGVTDRVKSDNDHDPVRLAERIAEVSGKAPLIHLAGKDRAPGWLLDALDRMRVAGLENVLLMTGDKVKSQITDRFVRYYDSVNMIMDTRATRGPFHVGAVVSPWKYREEELMSQYLKMVKKERAGADYFITQIGWDMLKFKELAAYRRYRGLRAPMMAGLMLLTAARSRYIRVKRIPGILITDSLNARLEAEARRADGGLGNALRRLALQIVGVKRLGYAGVQVTGIRELSKIDKLLSQVESLESELKTEEDWWEAWWDALRSVDGDPIETRPEHPFYLFRELDEPGGRLLDIDKLTFRELPSLPASSGEVGKFHALDRMDRWIFRDGSPGAMLLKPLSRLIPSDSIIDQGLHWLERRIKKPIVGCETCGFCRLPYTQYVCPETCPKGLANGPCGGTNENVCEFGERECIHNQKYRIAKAAGRLEELEALVIPAVDEARRGTCSWLNHFRGEDPSVIRVSDILVKRTEHVDRA